MIGDAFFGVAAVSTHVCSLAVRVIHGAVRLTAWSVYVVSLIHKRKTAARLLAANQGARSSDVGLDAKTMLASLRH